MATYNGDSADNVFIGTAGADQASGNGGNDSLGGGAGDDILDGGEGDDVLDGADGNDLLRPGSGNGSVSGGAGDDVIELSALAAGPGVSTLNGGSDFDTLDFSASSSALLFGSSWLESDRFSLGAYSVLNVEKIVSGSGSDTFALGYLAGAIEVRAGAGDDSFTGGSGADRFFGEAGADYAGVGAGDYADGGEGDDRFFLSSGSGSAPGSGTVHGGSGNDLLELGTLFSVDLAAGTATSGSVSYAVDGIESVSAAAIQGAVTTVLGSGADEHFFVNAPYNDGSVGVVFDGRGGNDVLSGSNGDDNLSGGDGDDMLIGGLGADTMAGGAGNDVYVSDHNGDVIVEAANGGIDEVRTSNQTYDIYNYANVENLTGTSAFGQNLSGNSLDNVIRGGVGSDLINGGFGNDTMIGGLGGDTYVVEQAGDIVIELAGEGTDRTDSGLASYTLTDNVEILVGRLMTGQTLTGNGLNNLVQARDGNDILDGGLGNDNMQGGLGNDTYYVDAAGDSVVENADSGTDSVFASVSYTLSANVENLTLTGTGNLNATGNDLANALVGTSGNNVLDGGAGADQMTGGLGDDTYIVDHAGDKANEAAGGGNDLVLASVSYVLGANVERLTLTGSGNITGVGNALNNVIVGNSGNNTLSGGAGADTMTGGLGNDTYIIDDAGDVIVEFSGQGVDTVQVGFTYTLTSTFENLTLTGSEAIDGTGNGADNVITGNSAANVLTGNGGNDTLDGGLGEDSMTGGLGNDIYVVDDGGDLVFEAAGAGTDTVRSSISYALEDNFEVLTLTGTADIAGTGNALANSLNGNSGSNRLDGGAGADLMAGGLGDDDYIVSDLGDRATETSIVGGYDTVWAAVSFYMTSNIEKIVLTGLAATTAVGNDLDNVVFGNTANNSLYGGFGNDRMDGGLGNDIYYVEQAGDIVTEFANSGTDTVVTTLSYTLGNFVENLTLTGSAALNGTGNDLNNVITGNSGANTLTGGIGNDTLIGGVGNDTLVGGVGNDVYVIDGGDTLVEAAGEGTDTVQSAISYTLLTNFEVLTLTGTANINGTGNSADNSLNGNGGNNVLDGGAGADQMFGGLGNDIYFIDNSGDKAVETSATGGTDEVKSSISFTIGANVENLTLTGSGAVNGFGNALDNLVTGNSGNNSLSGALGADTLDGGAGSDVYLYTSAADSTSAAMDHILSFTDGEKIDLSAIDASTTAAGNNAFAFVGAAGFSNTAGELRAYQSGSEWFLEGDVNGDGTADLVISVASDHALAAADFVF